MLILEPVFRFTILIENSYCRGQVITKKNWSLLFSGRRFLLSLHIHYTYMYSLNFYCICPPPPPSKSKVKMFYHNFKGTPALLMVKVYGLRRGPFITKGDDLSTCQYYTIFAKRLISNPMSSPRPKRHKRLKKTLSRKGPVLEADLVPECPRIQRSYYH